jgi:hypothetical protein
MRYGASDDLGRPPLGMGTHDEGTAAEEGLLVVPWVRGVLLRQGTKDDECTNQRQRTV